MGDELAKSKSGAKKTINGALLDVTHAADFLGITERALWARIARNQVPYRRWQGRITLRRDELEKFIEALDGVSVDEALENVRGAR